MFISISLVQVRGVIKNDLLTGLEDEIDIIEIGGDLGSEIIPNSYLVELQKPPVIEQQITLQEEKTELEIASISPFAEEMISEITPNVTIQEIKEIEKELENEHINALNDMAFLLDEPELASLKFSLTSFFKSIWDFIIKPFDFILSIPEKSITGFDISESSSQSSLLKYEYYSVFNGFAMEITPEQAEKIKQSKYVKEVYPDKMSRILLTDSVPLINADGVWNLKDDSGIDITGVGITVAVIDTGVDYTHADLGGCFGVGCKVIGGYDFVNSDADPMDDNGHGTHVAGTVASNGILKGVAPDAKILAYKICDATGSCSETNIIAGIEKAVNDNVDIISLSIGGSGNPDDLKSQAIDNAVLAGVVSVVAAGNSGPDGDIYCRNSGDGSLNSICSPGTARNAITVGASYNDFGTISELYIDSIFMESKGFAKSILINGLIGELKSVSGIGSVDNFTNSGDFTNKIALISRGIITFSEKVENAENAGAIGVIIYNNIDGELNGLLLEKSNIPVVSILQTDGQNLLNSLGQGIVNINMNVEYDINYPNTIAGFSSRGPTLINTIKPDVVAPGNYIQAQMILNPGGDMLGVCGSGNNYCAISGTSMATPHVSGAVALIKQMHPDWTPEEIKMALRNTAIDLGDNYTSQGWGRIGVLGAVQSEVPCVAELQTSDYIKNDIIGSANCRDFKDYILYYGEGQNPDLWTEISSSIIAVDRGILSSNFDASILTLGQDYTLRLVVNDNFGGSSEDRSFIKFAYQCNDGEDNDNDGLIDSEDNGCWDDVDDSRTYNSNLIDESRATSQCQDGIDNDNDGLIDMSDNGCDNPQDNDEPGECQDNFDNDQDFLVDSKDPGCWDDVDDSNTYNPILNDEGLANVKCQDGIDNDGDGFIDLYDDSCLGLWDNDEGDDVTYTEIWNFDDLNNVRNNPSGYYKLMIDIDLEGRQWEPIGKANIFGLGFTGVFDGAGNSIYNFIISGKTDMGFFSVSTGLIKNLNLKKVNMTAEGYSGILAGRNGWGNSFTNPGAIINSSSQGIFYIDNSIPGKNYGFGGLVAYNNGLIQDSYSKVNIKVIYNKSNEIGGLVGKNSAKIDNSYALGNISGGLHQIGGLVGYMMFYNVNNKIFAIINNSYANGNVITTNESSWIGGLVGEIFGQFGALNIIENSYAGGEVFGAAGVGGLVGKSNSEENIIKRSYANGNVDCVGLGCGGFIGISSPGTVIIDSYSIGNVVGRMQVGGFVGKNEGRIIGSYSRGDVIGSKEYYPDGTFIGEIGGFCGAMTEYTGINNSGIIENSYSEGSVSIYNPDNVAVSDVAGFLGKTSNGLIKNSYSNGAVNWGSNNGFIQGMYSSPEIVSSYYDKDTSLQSTSVAGEGKTTPEMKQQSTFVGWDFNNLWSIDEGVDYPKFKEEVIVCGNGIVDTGEDCNTCSVDVICSGATPECSVGGECVECLVNSDCDEGVGETCSDNICIGFTPGNCDECGLFGFFCDEAECHGFIDCYFEANLILPNTCDDLIDVCSVSVNFCSDYSEEECVADRCLKAPVGGNGCELDSNNDCVDASYCGDGVIDIGEDCNTCSVDVICSGATLECSVGGVCVACLNDGDCDDGDVCNGDETCNLGSCQTGAPMNCDNGVFCDGVETCDSSLGCQIGEDIVCSDVDGISCTQEYCDNTARTCLSDNTGCGCPNGLDSECPEDGDDCTDEICETDLTCGFSFNTLGCDDNNACTDNTFCSLGSCLGTPITCNDFKECTTNSCNVLTGCAYTPVQQGTGCSVGVCDDLGDCVECNVDTDCDIDVGETCDITTNTCAGFILGNCDECGLFGFFCDEAECHGFIDCYFEANLILPNTCDDLIDVCSVSVNFCSDYSEEECVADRCLKAPVGGNGCELDGNNDCVDASYCIPEDISITCGNEVCGGKINNCGERVICDICNPDQYCLENSCFDNEVNQSDLNINQSVDNKISFEENGTTLIELYYSGEMPNLDNYELKRGLFNNKSFFIVKGISGFDNKSVSFFVSNDSTGICIQDSDISEPSEIIDGCVYLNCPGLKDNYNCSIISGEIKKFKVIGLTHSGIIEADSTECGDSICTPEESCSICEADCGVCPSVDLLGGSNNNNNNNNNNGGGSSITCIYNTSYNWNCTVWSSCVKGVQTRNCNDYNNCRITVGKPSESKTCFVGGEGDEDTEEELAIERSVGEKMKSFIKTNKIWFIYGGIGIVVLIILGGFIWIILLILARKRKKQSKGKPKFESKIREKEIKQIKKIPIFSWFKEKGNKKTEKLLFQGEKNLSFGKVVDAKIIYRKVKKKYNSKYDLDKKLYAQIKAFYQNILKQNKS